MENSILSKLKKLLFLVFICIFEPTRIWATNLAVSEEQLIQSLEKTTKTIKALSGPVCEASPGSSPSPSPSPSQSAEKILIGIIVQSGTQGPRLKEQEFLKFGLDPELSQQIGSFNPKNEILINRLKIILNDDPSLYEDPQFYSYQVAADLLLKGAGSFYGSSDNIKRDSINAAEWFSNEIQNLRTMGIAQTEEQTQNLIAMMMDQMYWNYNDPLNPGSPGGDNRPRNIATMGAGYQQYLNDEFKTNDQGGVCDHIAAAGCQLWNKIYPDKPCYIVNIPGPGLQHWYTAIGNADGTYTLMDSGWRQKMAADGNPVSYAGNPQLFVPISKVNEAGDAIIVATPPSELMNYIRSISRPDTEEGQLFRGMSQAGFATFKLGKSKDKPLAITLGGGRGQLSNQNLGEQVWGIFANIDKTKKHLENKLTVFYAQVQGTQEGKAKVIGIDHTTAVFFAIPLFKNYEINLKAGMNMAAGAMLPEWPVTSMMYDVGYTGGAKIFGQTAIMGEKNLSSKTKLTTSTIFKAEGLPGIVITQMHGIDNGYGLKDGFKGFPTTFKNQNQIQLSRNLMKGVISGGLQGGASYGPLNYSGKPDWNLGGNFSYLNSNQTGFQGINTAANVNQYNTIFNSGRVAKVSVGSTFSVNGKRSNRKTIFIPSLSTQLSNYGNEVQFFGGAGLMIRFDQVDQNKKPR